MKYLFILIVFTPLCFTEAFSEDSIATALIVKGNVTYLSPGKRNASPLKKGVKLLKDTSIYVKGKGFAKIKFINSSSMTIGPNSKVAVEMDLSDKTTLVNLISGKIRAKVDKNIKNDKKFLVKTSSATMGVRGTEFQITHSPTVKKTSLLTYNGQVDMKKTKIEGTKDTSIKSVSNHISDLKKDLTLNPTSVNRGDYIRMANTDIQKAEKVKINPKQFLLLEKDEKLGAQKMKLTKKEKISLAKKSKELEKEFKKDIEKSGGKIRNSLGFIDIDKAVYIPPVDSKNKKYLGKISENGEYIPPKGVVIDAEKGIVLKARASKKIKNFINKVNKENQVPAEIIKKSQNAYERYFDV